MTEKENNIDIAEEENLSQVEKEETIGSFLRQAREEKSLPIRTVSQNTKVSTTLLEFLEQDKLDLLPNKTYVIGFIKSYCKAVKADERYAIELLNKAYNVQGQTQEDQVDTILASNEKKEPLPKPLIQFGLAGSILALLLIFILNTSDDSNKGQKEEVKKVVVATPAPTATPVKVVEEKKEEVKKVVVATPAPTATPVKVVEEKKEEVKKVVVATPAPTATPVKVVEEKKEEVKKITFRPMRSKLFSFSEKPDEENLQYLPSRYKDSIVEGKQNVVINATDGDTWITYKSDQDAIKKFVLKKGRSVLIRGEEVRLFLGNVNAAKIFANNKLLAIKAPSGVKSLVFPESNKEKYMLPLFIYNNDGTVLSSDEYIKKMKDSTESTN